MEVVRLVHASSYNIREGQFSSAAYENWRGGLSVVNHGCVVASNTTICAYIHKYLYRSHSYHNPPVFWRLDTDDLPDNKRIDQARSRKNPCHDVVRDVTDDQLAEAFETVDLSDLEICEGGVPRSLELADVISIQTALAIQTENNA